MTCDLAFRDNENAIQAQSDVYSLNEYYTLIQSVVHVEYKVGLKREEFLDFGGLKMCMTRSKSSPPYNSKMQERLPYELQGGILLCNGLWKKFATW